ncbi:MAG TPA: hypothetical protein VEQ35_09415 [Beijerinckia sp.]|jgi:hypothetical protein|nr:hypothetical protein [Beijerinckia sp.]
MFDIVTPDDDKLTLPVEIEGIDDAESRLPSPAPRHTKPSSEREPEDQKDKDRRDEKSNQGGSVH